MRAKPAPVGFFARRLPLKFRPVYLVPVLAAVSMFSIQIPSGLSVPAFARREGASCSMCHFRMPEPNEDGHAYIRRGLREERGGMMPGMKMGGGEETPKSPAGSTTRRLGDPLPLEWQNYLTVMGNHMLEARRHERIQFQSGTIDAWIGGPLDPRWSVLADVAFDIQEGGVDVEQAYGQYISSWASRFVSVRFGQLLPLAILFNGGGAAMPLSAPVILETPFPSGNPWTPTALLRGVELGIVHLPRWSAYVGAGQPQLEGGEGGNRTDLYASAEVLAGKQGNAVSIFGYHGKLTPAPGEAVVKFERIALFANAYAPRAKGILGLLWGRDRPEDDGSRIGRGAFLLGEFLPTERWAGYARYDLARGEIPAGGHETTDGPTLGISFWAQTQVRLTLEARLLKQTGAPRDRTATAEFLWAF
ncbi:MAG: hypothetical protein ACM3PF_10650 [Bacteroidota bacterium]